MSTVSKKILLIFGSLLLVGGLFAACGDDGDGGGDAPDVSTDEGSQTVKVVMAETDEAFTFELDRTEVPAGEVTFEVTNDGELEHELMVYTPQDMSHMIQEMVEAEESGGGGHSHAHEEIAGLVISADGEAELELEPGESGTFVANLEPGIYELGCIITETVGGETFNHYDKGMHTTLTVVGEGTDAGDTGAPAGEAQQLAIGVQEIGHWHVFAAKELQFTVTDVSGAGVTGLDVTAQIVRAASDHVSELSTAEGDITDNGDGVYAVEYTPSSIGSYSVVVRVDQGGSESVSVPVAFEVAKSGEEDIRVDAQGTSYVYQIRYWWDPGHVHASHEEAVSLNFEIMRGIPEGDDINWEQPWSNPLNHIVDAENATVQLTSADGAVSETLDAEYQGKGVYVAERIFPPDEVGEENDYKLQFTFTDPFNGAEVTHAEAFGLHAVSAH